MVKFKYIFSFLIALSVLLFINDLMLNLIVATILFILFMNEITKIEKDILDDQSKTVHQLRKQLSTTTKKETEMKERFFTLTEEMKNAFILINNDSIVEYVNPIFYEYFGNIYILEKDYTKVNINKELKKVINDGYLFEKNINKIIKVKDRYLDVLSTPLFEDGHFVGSIVIAHDITAIKSMENFQKSFIADVSHELRTPVAAIKAASEILLRDEPIDVDMKREFLEIIQNENNRMDQIVQDLLEISQLERENNNLNISEVNIVEVFKYIKQILGYTAENKGLELIYTCEDNLRVNADSMRLKQALINLVKNAINYTDHGIIELKAMEDSESIIIEVRDSGIGITSNEINHIFDRFYRIDRARSRDTGGTGLGLSIVKKIIDKHNGKIEVTSEVNKGTIFKITLPK